MGYTRQSAALAVLIFEVLNKDKFSRKWTKQDILNLFFTLIPNFSHQETGKYLDQKM